MVDGFAQLIEAVDDGWTVVAIFVLGLYGLLWRFGGQIMTLVSENSVVGKEIRAAHRKSSAEFQVELAKIQTSIDDLAESVKPMVDDVAALKSRVSDLEGGHDAGSS
jgi:hypothetical protein